MKKNNLALSVLAIAAAIGINTMGNPIARISEEFSPHINQKLMHGDVSMIPKEAPEAAPGEDSALISMLDHEISVQRNIASEIQLKPQDEAADELESVRADDQDDSLKVALIKKKKPTH